MGMPSFLGLKPEHIAEEMLATNCRKMVKKGTCLPDIHGNKSFI
jgi:hypothetical protein